jgi:uridine kinase
MNFLTVESINSAIEKNPESFIKLSEDIYSANIKTAARNIRLFAASKPIVLISGPSGSAKTTTARRLKESLIKHGVPAVTVSMDNYFYPKTEALHTPKTADGEIDFESPYRVDIPLFTKHMKAFYDCKEVDMPHFDFLTQVRSNQGVYKREEGGVVIIEGIHALNPLVVGDSDTAFSLFVSVSTRILQGVNHPTAHRSLNPAMIRLMRRLCRDRRFRGRTVEEIWKMYKLVALGEENYITPFRNRANLDIDTFIPYEAAVYKNFLLASLTEISRVQPDNEDLSLLSQVLSEVISMDIGDVPEESIVREFIG